MGGSRILACGGATIPPFSCVAHVQQRQPTTYVPHSQKGVGAPSLTMILGASDLWAYLLVSVESGQRPCFYTAPES